MSLPKFRTYQPALAAAILLAVALLWMHPQISTQNTVYASSDAQSAAAFQRVAQQALDAGEFPHWNPFVFMGMPSYASLAYPHGAYPLTEPLKIARDRFHLPPMNWLLFHFWLAAMFTTAWMRWRGQSWVVAIAAGAWLIAVPKLVAWGAYGHGTKVGTFAWLPLALWCTEGLIRRARVQWAAGLALALSMILLRAHPQIAYYSALTIGVVLLFHVVAQWRAEGFDRRVWMPVALVVAAGLVALMASASIYLPVLEYQAHSIRGGSSGGGGAEAATAAFEYATSWSLSWQEFASQWWSTTAGYGRGSYVGTMPFTDYPNYIGLPLLLLAAFGFVQRRDRFNGALLALTLFATLVALGNHFPLYRVLYEVLPGFKKFRVPVMILIIQELAVILLAAQGLDWLGKMAGVASRPRWLGKPMLIIVAGLGVLGLIFGTVGGSALREMAQTSWVDMARALGRTVPPSTALRVAADLAVGDALRLGAIFLAAALVFGARSRGRIPALAALSLVSLLVFIDLWRVDQPLLRPENHLVRLAQQDGRLITVPSEGLLRDAEILASYNEGSALTEWLLQQEDRPRVLPLGGLEADNRLAAHGIVSLGGYHAAKLRVYEDLRSKLFDQRRPRLEVARLFGARWIVVPSPLGAPTLEALERLGLPVNPEPAFANSVGHAYEILDPLPRAWVVPAFSTEERGSDSTGERPASKVMDRTLDADFNPRRIVILSDEPDFAPAQGAESATVEILHEGYNSLRFKVDLDRPGILVMADPWYPSWKARVDGEPARVLRANYAQRAVSLAAGSHEVELNFDAASYRAGRRVAMVSGLLILVGLLQPAFAGQMNRRKARTSENSNSGETA